MVEVLHAEVYLFHPFFLDESLAEMQTMMNAATHPLIARDSCEF